LLPESGRGHFFGLPECAAALFRSFAAAASPYRQVSSWSLIHVDRVAESNLPSGDQIAGQAQRISVGTEDQCSRLIVAMRGLI
jgi:hypothetical protein